MNLFIFGIGFSGIEIAKSALAAGAAVAGTTRSSSKAQHFRALGIDALLFEAEGDLTPLIAPLETTTHLLISIGPDSAADPVLNALKSVIETAMPRLEWIGYLSTVGVYGDHQGGWVNEESECRPGSNRSVERLKAEQEWQDLAQLRNAPLAILRLSGIYGPGRNTFVNLADGSARRIIKQGQYFNRIHVSDIAGAAMFLGHAKTGGVFNVTDDEPCPPQDVVTYAAALMGIAPPAEIAFEDAKMSEMARSFYGEVKRVSNARITSLGYSFKMPNYRAALDNMWQNQNWR